VGLSERRQSAGSGTIRSPCRTVRNFYSGGSDAVTGLHPAVNFTDAAYQELKENDDFDILNFVPVCLRKATGLHFTIYTPAAQGLKYCFYSFF